MRAMQITALGAPLAPAELPVPVPGPGEALVRVHACGVNFADTLMQAGRYQERHEPPFTPGMEICGTVKALGPEPGGAQTGGPETGRPETGGLQTGGLQTGMRVACYCGSGGFAEVAAVPARLCVPVPEAMSDEAAAGFLIAYGTSHLALDHRAGLRPGETLLVLGAAGGVGLTAVEIGKVMGARVIASARGADKLAAAEAAGADYLIDADDDLRAAVKALGGADVVYDPVGGAAFDAALRATKPGGRLLPLGFASGGVPQIPANILLVKNLTVHGLYWGAYATLKPSVMADSIATLFRWYGEGRLAPHVSHVLPLREANAALDLLATRRATGKVVIRVAD